MSDIEAPKKERVEYEGALYHVMDRGNRLEVIFCDDGDSGHRTESGGFLTV